MRGSKHITRFSTELEGNSPESEGKKHDSKLPLNNKRGDWDLVRFLSSSYQTYFKYYSQILNHIFTAWKFFVSFQLMNYSVIWNNLSLDPQIKLFSSRDILFTEIFQKDPSAKERILYIISLSEKVEISQSMDVCFIKFIALISWELITSRGGRLTGFTRRTRAHNVETRVFYELPSPE